MGSTSSNHSTILSNNNNHPFFSTLVTLYLLIFLYSPHCFLKLILSPILISTLILLLFILRLGASQQIQQQQQPNKNTVEPEPELCPDSDLKLEPETDPNPGSAPELATESDPKPDSELFADTNQEVEPEQPESEPDPKPDPSNNPQLYCGESFEERGVWGPLAVIYEAYEGEECEEETRNDAFSGSHSGKVGIGRYPSLSRYYPESESESESDTDSLSSSCSLDEDLLEIQRWEREEEKEGMFEIALDYGFGDEMSGMVMKKLRKEVEIDDEDNMIEIDFSF